MRQDTAQKSGNGLEGERGQYIKTDYIYEQRKLDDAVDEYHKKHQNAFHPTVARNVTNENDAAAANSPHFGHEPNRIYQKSDFRSTDEGRKDHSNASISLAYPSASLSQEEVPAFELWNEKTSVANSSSEKNARLSDKHDSILLKRRENTGQDDVRGGQGVPVYQTSSSTDAVPDTIEQPNKSQTSHLLSDEARSRRSDDSHSVSTTKTTRREASQILQRSLARQQLIREIKETTDALRKAGGDIDDNLSGQYQKKLEKLQRDLQHLMHYPQSIAEEEDNITPTNVTTNDTKRIPERTQCKEARPQPEASVLPREKFVNETHVGVEQNKISDEEKEETYPVAEPGRFNAEQFPILETRDDIVEYDTVHDGTIADRKTDIFEGLTVRVSREDEPSVMASVRAPVSLPESYTLEVVHNGKVFNATVPKGGVAEGEAFSSALHHPAQSSGTYVVNPVLGHWRDGIGSCCEYGLMHPMMWTGICWPQLALAQILTRMKLTWRAEPGHRVYTRMTFGVVIMMFFWVVVLNAVIILLPLLTGFFTWIPFGTMIVLDTIYITFFLYTVIRTRQFLRTSYMIPEKNCRGCEDVCVSLWCTSCTIMQMGRHTADYDTFTAHYCTSTGLPKNVAVNLPAPTEHANLSRREGKFPSIV